jgi:hypothetical protein
MHTPRNLLRVVLVNSLLIAGTHHIAAAQRQTQPPPSVDSVLSLFERDAARRSRLGRGTDRVMDILQGSPPAARTDSLLNGLLRLATTGANEDVRASATIYFGSAGTRPRPVPIVAGLARIYHAPNGLRLQTLVIDQMTYQVDRTAAVSFLRAVAASPDSRAPHPVHGYSTHGEPRAWALARLAEMGTEGQSALRAMHRGGEARSPQARTILDGMAARGFPVVDARRLQAQRDSALRP